MTPFRPIIKALGDVRELEKLKILQSKIVIFQRQVGLIADQVLTLAGKIGEVGQLIWLALGYVFWAIGRLKQEFVLLAGGA